MNVKWEYTKYVWNERLRLVRDNIYVVAALGIILWGFVLMGLRASYNCVGPVVYEKPKTKIGAPGIHR